MSVDAILSVEEGQEIKAGDVVARIPREGAKTKDITGGLPRVAELFEARRPKDHAIIAEIDGYVRFGRDYKNKRRITIEPSDDTQQPVEYMVPKGKHIPVAEGDFVQKGDYIMDGNPAPHDILAIMGVEALADYMIDEVQDVYRLQGVKINDKHIEVIVRQMLQKWEIQESGTTTLLKGEHVDKAEFDAANEKAVSKGGKPGNRRADPAWASPRRRLQTRSFISAASFQETTRVLTEASVQGKRDKLVGLKENVIVGRLIPAGTGGAAMNVRRIATERDSKVIEAARAEAEAAAALAAPVPEEAPPVGEFDNVFAEPRKAATNRHCKNRRSKPRRNRRGFFSSREGRCLRREYLGDNEGARTSTSLSSKCPCTARIAARGSRVANPQRGAGDCVWSRSAPPAKALSSDKDIPDEPEQPRRGLDDAQHGGVYLERRLYEGALGPDPTVSGGVSAWRRPRLSLPSRRLPVALCGPGLTRATGSWSASARWPRSRRRISSSRRFSRCRSPMSPPSFRRCH